MRRVLDDLKVLSAMLDRGMFESGARRVGAEQEVVLVDGRWDAAPVGPEVLERIGDPRLTTEIGRFNLEINSTPRRFGGAVLRELQGELDELLARASEVAGGFGARVLLTGILPTMQVSDLRVENLSPRERYWRLNEVITAQRQGRYELRIKGIDELTFRHDTVLVEALNTSFQLHWQTDPADFAHAYNIAQALAGPVLASGCNSPVLFGKRLWAETRIAIFEQSVDTRRDGSPAERDLIARVRFGDKWVESSVLDLFQEDVARMRVLLASGEEEDARGELDAGRVPALRALQAHNGCVYRWNRPCYGVTDGRPHLRIENRYLPSGPTTLDEIATAALWFGLMAQLPEELGDLTTRMDFADAKANFMAAAHHGLGAEMRWLDDRTPTARDLVLNELLPAARRGLDKHGVDPIDAERYLGVVRARIESGQTGTQWMLRSIARMKGQGTRAERLGALTAAMSARQSTGAPVHEWALAELAECGDWEQLYVRVGQYMATDLFTVNEEELIDLAASIMDWERVRHVPVEDDDHKLVGIVSYRDLLKLVAEPDRTRDTPISVGEVMQRSPATVGPETTTLDAIRIMKEHSISCLPVVSADGKLMGLVTEHDFMTIAGQLLEERLGHAAGAGGALGDRDPARDTEREAGGDHGSNGDAPRG